MKSTAKAQALLRDVQDKLAKRFPAGASGINTIRAAFDANGWPMLFLSHNATETAGSPVILVRISAIDAVSKDIFGNALTAFAPHILEVAYELGLASLSAYTGANPVDVQPARSDIQIALFECIKTGVRLQVKEIAQGTAVSESAINAASASLDIEELAWPTKSV